MEHGTALMPVFDEGGVMLFGDLPKSWFAHFFGWGAHVLRACACVRQPC